MSLRLQIAYTHLTGDLGNHFGNVLTGQPEPGGTKRFEEQPASPFD